MIQNKKQELFERLKAKDLDHKFRYRIEHGMGCSPFVSEAIMNVVKKVYFPLLYSPLSYKPGQLLFQCLSQKNGAATSIANSEQINVILTLDAGKEDIEIRRQGGVLALRRHRIVRVCHEAYSQDGLLTVEDLAYRLFNVGERTIIRDLQIIRQNNENPPLRSTIKDIGRTITHRAVILKNWLLGDELSDLQRKHNHSLSSIENYITTFKRVVALSGESYTREQIAYMLKISTTLVETNMSLWHDFHKKALPHRKEEIEEVLRSTTIKKSQKRRRV